MKVIYIDEDAHGFIGLATDYKAAIDFLVNEHWLTDTTEIWDDNADCYRRIVEIYGEGWVDLFRDTWNMEDFNDFADGWFYLEEKEVYGS